MELVVNTPFLTYNVGDLITDPAAIATVLGGQYANDVVVIGQSGGSGAPESITLAVTSAVTGTALGLAGAVSNATPSALDYSIDGGTTWSGVTSFTFTGGNYSGKGPTYSTAQSGTIEVRDRANPSAISSVASFTVTVASGGGSGNGTISLADGNKFDGLSASLEVTGGSGTPGPLSVQFGTTTGTVADGGALAAAAAVAAAAVPASSVGQPGGVAPLNSSSQVAAGVMSAIGTQVWAEQVGSANIFHRGVGGVVPTSPSVRYPMTFGDKWKLGAVFNFGEVWDTQASYDAYPALQNFLLYCQLMRLAMHNTSLDNVAFRTFVKAYLPAGDYLTSEPLVVPEYVMLDGPGRILRTPYVGAQTGGTLTQGQFYAADGTTPGTYLPTVIITPRAHAGMLNVYTNGGSGSLWFRGSGVAIGKFWSWLYGGTVTIGAAGTGYSVGDFIYSASPQQSPYQGGYIVVDAVNGSGGVTAAHVYPGDRLVNGSYGCGCFGLPPNLQIQQWTTANGFPGVFDPSNAGYFMQASTFNAAGAAGTGTGCTFLPTWMSDFAGGNYQFGGYGQRSAVQADTIIEHINITGSIHSNYSSTYGPTFGVLVMGLNGVIGEIELLGANTGVNFVYANDWRVTTINCVLSGTGIQVYSSGSIEMPSVVLDTCGCATLINESSRIIMRGLAFFEEENFNAGTAFPDSNNYAVLIGNSSNGTYLNVDLDVDLTLINMGGVPQSTLNLPQFAEMSANGIVAITMTASLYLAYVKSSRIKLMISNWSENGEFYSYLPTMAFVEFHAGVDQSVVLDGCIDQIAGPACIGAVSTSACDVRVWDAGTGSGWPGGRAGVLGTYDIKMSGVPSNGTGGTGAGKAGPGSTCMNVATGILYRQTGTLSSPTWTTP